MTNIRFVKPVISSSKPTHAVGGEKIGARSRIFVTGLEQLIRQNIPALRGAVTYEAMTSIAQVISHLLANAQPRVPVDSGKLRTSGRANIVTGSWARVVAEGRADGTIKVKNNAVTINDIAKSNILQISGNVNYSRVNEDREDIALWAHEDLFPHEARLAGRKPAARTPGTGPKYLEIPFLEHKGTYAQILKDAFGSKLIRDLGSIMSVTKRRKNEYEVDEVSLTLSKIEKSGYYGR